MPRTFLLLLYFLTSALLLLGGCDSSQVSDAPVNETQPNDSALPDDSNDPAPLPPETSNPPPPDEQACQPTASEQLMLDLVNAARAQTRDCGGQTYSATSALKWNCNLLAAADKHSRDMATNNFFNHTGSDGLSVSNRVTTTGYQWRAVGENIAAGQPAEEVVMQDWIGSPGHCKNIMNPTYEDFGSAVIFTDQADFSSYWTQVFAAAR